MSIAEELRRIAGPAPYAHIVAGDAAVPIEPPRYLPVSPADLHWIADRIERMEHELEYQRERACSLERLRWSEGIATAETALTFSARLVGWALRNARGLDLAAAADVMNLAKEAEQLEGYPRLTKIAEASRQQLATALDNHIASATWYRRVDNDTLTLVSTLDLGILAARGRPGIIAWLMNVGDALVRKGEEKLGAKVPR